jgi:lipid-A-disaccharide synthase
VFRDLGLVKVRHIAAPNLLAGRELVKEFVQDAATPEALGAALLALLDDPEQAERLRADFAAIHRSLRRDASRAAARAVLEAACTLGDTPALPGGGAFR